MQPGPILFAAGDLNLHTYVNNDAGNRTDPLGCLLTRVVRPGDGLFGWGRPLGFPLPGAPKPVSGSGAAGGSNSPVFSDSGSGSTNAEPAGPKGHSDNG